MNSIKHHYVPQLYLRGFVAETGRLQVFDKKLDCFKKDKQTPRTVLYEKHRNTILHKGVRTDALEKLYGTIEAPLGEFFDLVRNGISSEELISKDGLYLLKIFIEYTVNPKQQVWIPSKTQCSLCAFRAILHIYIYIYI